MNTTPATHKHLFSWRLLYAFIIVWLSSFTLLSPLARRDPVQFTSTAELHYALNPLHQVADDELLSLMRSVVGRDTQPIVLGQIREQIGERGIVARKPMNALSIEDLDALRQRLSISQNSQDGRLRLAISMLGTGNPEEQAFVNQLANRLALDIPRHSEQLAVNQMLKSNHGYLDMAKQVNLAEQIRAEVAQLNESIVDLRIQVLASDSKTLAEQISALESQKLDLRQNQGLDDSHPQLVLIQQQIEALRTEALDDPAFRPVQLGTDMSADLGETTKNRFYQASSTSAIGPTAAPQVAARLAEIDLSRIGTAASQLKAHAESADDLKQDIDAALAGRFDSNAQLFSNLASVSYAKFPTMLVSSGRTPTWLLIIPCLIGSLVAMYYNPLTDRMQLKSIGDVTRCMKLRIIGELPMGQSPKPQPRVERLSAVSVRTAEYALIAIGCILFAACTMKPQIFSVALTNPLLALSNWFWLIAS